MQESNQIQKWHKNIENNHILIAITIKHCKELEVGFSHCYTNTIHKFSHETLPNQQSSSFQIYFTIFTKIYTSLSRGGSLNC